MSKIKFENGTVVNFDGNPTPQDVEEVANKLGLHKQNDGSLPTHDQVHQSFLQNAGEFITGGKFGQNVAQSAYSITGGAKKIQGITNQYIQNGDTLLALANKQTDPAKKLQYAKMAQQMYTDGGMVGDSIIGHVRSIGQQVGDAAGLMINLASAGGLGSKALRSVPKVTGIIPGAVQGVKVGSLLGGAYGVAQGAAQGLQNEKTGAALFGSELLGGVEGAGTGGVIGGATGAVAGGINAIKSEKPLFTGKNFEDVINTPIEKVHTLKPSERQAWFDNQKQLIDSLETDSAQKAKDLLKTQGEATAQQIKDLQNQLATASRDKVIELRPKIVQAMREQSQVYRNLIDEEIAGKENIPIKISDLKNYVDTQYADNPNLSNTIKNKLGLDTQLNPNPKAPFKTSVGEIYDQIKGLKSDISAGATRGTKVFTTDDVNTDKAINTLTGFLKQQGVDFSEANKFWSQYAPIRNQLVSEAKPFLQTGTQTKTFANTLMRVAKGTDVNNENFINEVEKILGEPITKENRAIVAQLSETEKTALANKVASEESIINSQMEKDSSMKKLSATQFEIERKARIRKVVVNAIKFMVGGTVGYNALKKFGVPFP